MDAIFAQAHAALQCLICKDELRRPASIPCGHNFCEACIILSLQSHGNKCPECHQPCWSKDVIRNQMLENLVNRLHDAQPLATQVTKGWNPRSAVPFDQRPASQTPRGALRRHKGSTAPPLSARKADTPSSNADSGSKRQRVEKESPDKYDQGLRQPDGRAQAELNGRHGRRSFSEEGTALERSHKDEDVVDALAASSEGEPSEERRSLLAKSFVVDETPEKLAPLREPLSTQEELKLEATVAAQEEELRQIDKQLIAMGVDPETRLSQLETDLQEVPSAFPRLDRKRASPALRAVDEGHVQHLTAQDPAEARRDGCQEEAESKEEEEFPKKEDVVSKKEDAFPKKGVSKRRKGGRAEKAGVLGSQERGLCEVETTGKEDSCRRVRPDEKRENKPEDRSKHRNGDVLGGSKKERRPTDTKGSRQTVEEEPKNGKKRRSGNKAEALEAAMDPFAFKGSRERSVEGVKDDATRIEGANGQKKQKKRKTLKGDNATAEERRGQLKADEKSKARGESFERTEGPLQSEPSFLDSSAISEELPQMAYSRRKRKDLTSAATKKGTAHKRRAKKTALQSKCDAGEALASLQVARNAQKSKVEKQSGKKKSRSQGLETLKKQKKDESPTGRTSEHHMLQAEKRSSEAAVQDAFKRPEEQLPCKAECFGRIQGGKDEVNRVIAETPEKDDFADWGLGLEEDELDQRGLVKSQRGRETPLKERLEAAAPYVAGPQELPTEDEKEEGHEEGAGKQEGQKGGREERAKERAPRRRGAKREPLREVSNARAKKLRSPDSEASIRKDLREAIARSLSNC